MALPHSRSTVMSRLCLGAALVASLSLASSAGAQSYSSSAASAEISTASLPDAPSAQLAQEQQQQQKEPDQQKQPAQNPGAPSLSDLGLSPSQTTANPALQARLDRHTQMLKIHQRLGLYTLIPMAAAVISSGGAGEHHNRTNGTVTTTGSTTGRNIHVALGSATVGMYAATAYFAIAAPKIPEGHTKGGIKAHKYLIYLHAPGMVLTPILGAMAYNQLNSGQKVHGIASAHAAVAWTTVLSYSAAMVAVSWPIKL